MKIKLLHPNAKLPQRGSDLAGGYDIFMPEEGKLWFGDDEACKIGLGFAAAIPEGYVGLVVPRSGKGAKSGLELNNTVGVIDADYRGEWFASLRLKNTQMLSWEAGDRLLQVLFVKAEVFDLEVADSLDDTVRGEGGEGSTGK